MATMSSNKLDQPSSENLPWHAAFPSPKASVAEMPVAHLLDLIESNKSTAKPSYLLVDVRRNDHEGGTISTSINLPAQSIYYSLPTLVSLVKATQSIKCVVFYCGSSRGRGPRCANWFQDVLDASKEAEVKSFVLEGGIKGWVRSGREPGNERMLGLMAGYEPTYWDQFMNE